MIFSDPRGLSPMTTIVSDFPLLMLILILIYSVLYSISHRFTRLFLNFAQCPLHLQGNDNDDEVRQIVYDYSCMQLGSSISDRLLAITAASTLPQSVQLPPNRR